MQIIRTLCITSDEFYELIENSLVEYANKDKDEKEWITVSDIKEGLKLKKGGEGNPESMTITTYQRGKLYRTKTHLMTDEIFMEYVTEDTPQGLKVTYTQEIDSFNKKKKSGFMYKWSQALFLSRMSNSLYDMQNHIIREKEGIKNVGEAMMKRRAKFAKTVNKHALKFFTKQDNK